jgi:hypothetical protein
MKKIKLKQGINFYVPFINNFIGVDTNKNYKIKQNIYCRELDNMKITLECEALLKVNDPDIAGLNTNKIEKQINSVCSSIEKVDLSNRDLDEKIQELLRNKLIIYGFDCINFETCHVSKGYNINYDNIYHNRKLLRIRNTDITEYTLLFLIFSGYFYFLYCMINWNKLKN